MFAQRFSLSTCRHQIVALFVKYAVSSTVINCRLHQVPVGKSQSSYSSSTALKYLKMSSTKQAGQSKKSPLMTISPRVQLSIIGNGSNANPTAIAVVTDRETFLFNCGEGVQRLIIEHKIKIGKIRHVMFTSLRHESFSGFFGFLLTIAQNFTETGHHLQVYAPSQFEKISQIYSRFTYHATKGVNISYRDIDPPSTEELGDSEDSCRSIESGSDDRSYKTDGSEENDDMERIKDTKQVLLDDVDFKVISFRLYSVAKMHVHSFAYVFLMKDKPGQLLVEKCKQLNVPPGPLFAKLKAGQSIEVNGKTVSPDDVLGPAEVGPAFVILECPTLYHTHSLINNNDLSEYLEGKELKLIVHIAPKHVFTNVHYQRWLAGFSSSVKHIPLNADNQSEPCLITSSTAQVKLNAADGHIFKALNERTPDTENIINNKFEVSSEQTVVSDCPTMLTYTFRPSREFGFSLNADSCRLRVDDILKDTMEDVNFAAKLEEYKDSVSTLEVPTTTETSKKSNSFKPNVLFLGTASASPGKQRNTSAILLNLTPEASMLLDCGEATYLQLHRFYGKKGVKEVLGRLRAIFISHNHADHHFGLVRLIRERERIYECTNTPLPPPLILIVPDCIEQFLVEFGAEVAKYEKLYRQYSIIKLQDLLFEEQMTASVATAKRQAMAALSLSELVTVRVPHCRDSHGIVITTEGGEKIAYTGDTLFSDAFDRAGLDATLLIHEATMNDDLAEEAKEKRHSTISEAIRAGFNCKAKFTMLTHFSQRYAKVAPVDSLQGTSASGDDKESEASQLAKYSENNVGYAFDFMNLELDQLWRAAKMKPLLETLFADDIQEMSERREKTALKRKLVDETLKV